MQMTSAEPVVATVATVILQPRSTQVVYVTQHVPLSFTLQHSTYVCCLLSCLSHLMRGRGPTGALPYISPALFMHSCAVPVRLSGRLTKNITCSQFRTTYSKINIISKQTREVGRSPGSWLEHLFTVRGS